jgi:hypothetical protein
MTKINTVTARQLGEMTIVGAFRLSEHSGTLHTIVHGKQNNFQASMIGHISLPGHLEVCVCIWLETGKHRGEKQGGDPHGLELPKQEL